MHIGMHVVFRDGTDRRDDAFYRWMEGRLMFPET
jgi:hypothetical protein